jgi:GNAT superfamily N-acetyltransferase
MERIFISAFPLIEKYSFHLILDQIEAGFITVIVPTEVSLERLSKIEERPSYIKWWKENALHKPYVDFSFIEKEFRGKGYGKKLYKVAAIWLKKKYGLKLWSSQNQSKEAKRLWKSFKTNSDKLFNSNGEWIEFL